MVTSMGTANLHIRISDSQKIGPGKQRPSQPEGLNLWSEVEIVLLDCCAWLSTMFIAQSFLLSGMLHALCNRRMGKPRSAKLAQQEVTSYHCTVLSCRATWAAIVTAQVSRTTFAFGQVSCPVGFYQGFGPARNWFANVTQCP